MILDNDKHIQETIFDNISLSIHILKKLGWYVQFGQKRYETWLKFVKQKGSDYPNISRFSNGEYYLTITFGVVKQIHTVGDLKKYNV